MALNTNVVAPIDAAVSAPTLNVAVSSGLVSVNGTVGNVAVILFAALFYQIQLYSDLVAQGMEGVCPVCTREFKAAWAGQECCSDQC